MWRLRVLVAVMALGCAGNRVEIPAERQEGGRGGAGGSGGTPRAGSPTGGMAGADVPTPIPEPEPEPEPPMTPPFPPAPHAAIACASPEPHELLGGFTQCGDGTFRRPAPAACVSHLPFVPTDDTKVASDCELDTDCPGEHDYCEWGLCQHGCVADDECAGGQLCFCEEPVGRCVEAACRSDADCPAGYPCTGVVGQAGFRFGCQSPNDECLADLHCRAIGPNPECVQTEPRTCQSRPG